MLKRGYIIINILFGLPAFAQIPERNKYNMITHKKKSNKNNTQP